MLGDSYAHHFRAFCRADDHVDAAGWRGARLADDEFRRWAIRETVLRRPRNVFLMVGGNDLARPTFRLRQFFVLLRELVLGLLAAGAETVFLLPLPPRSQLRTDDVSARRYQQRRWLVNRLIRRKFCRPPVQQVTFVDSAGFLGADGVHPSDMGWRALRSCVNDCRR